MTDPTQALPRLARRRLLLSGLSAFAAASTATACDLASTQPDRGSDDSGIDTRDQKQAPMLAQQVDAGDLPSLANRLPAEPLEVQPNDRVGVYGGEWRTALFGPADTAWLERTLGYENLVRWDITWETVIPNVALDFHVNDDGTEFVFDLRPGLKWSDGEPFTADDIVFYYNDVILNEELTPSVPQWLIAGGQPANLEKLDEHTIAFTFAAPNGLFLGELATPSGRGLTRHPQHYFGEFHKEHNPDIDEVVRREGAADWVQLFGNMGGGDGGAYWQSARLPTLQAWTLTQVLGDGSRVVADRNPFYFKVDPDARQLPYIDRIIYDVVNDIEAMLTKALNGELDMHVRHFNTLKNKPVLADGRDDGSFGFFQTIWDEMNTFIVNLNLTHKNPDKRAIFQNKNFRIGLSHAINRQEIIDTVYQRQGQPYQAAVRPEDKFYDEEFAQQYTEYNVELANTYLDRAGYAERNGDGIRLGPDGEPIRFAVEFYTGLFPEWADALELTVEYWREVGIDGRAQPVDRSLWTERTRANEFDASIFVGVGGLKSSVLLGPSYYLPSTGSSHYARAWERWYNTGGEEGEEPPAATKEQMRLYDELRETIEPDRQDELMKAIIDIAKDEFYAIGVNLTPHGYGIVKSSFHNVPDEMYFSFLYPTPAATNPEQYFIQEQ